MNGHRTQSVTARRAGSASIAMLVVLMVVSLVIVAMVLAGARDQDLTIVRMETIRAFYSAEAGMNMARRELSLGSDEDGDGGVGTISDDGNPGNDPLIGSAPVSVTGSTSGATTTFTSAGRAGSAERRVAIEATGGSSAMIAYGRNGATPPQYRLWDGSTWASEQSANSTGASPQWVVLRGHPSKAALALAILDNDVDIEVQIYSGGAWGSVFQATSDAGDKTTRVFDLAYEQVSGDLLLAYRKGGTSSICYRTYNGSAWSAESTYSLSVGTIKWLGLATRVGSDELLLVAQGDAGSNHVRAAIWDGNAFGNATVIATGASPDTYCHACGALEGASGEALVVYNDGSSSPGYRTFTGGAWSGALSAPSVGGAPQWITLAPHPSNDSVILAVLGADSDINVNVWNGSAWGSNAEAETNAGTTTSRCFDIAWQNGASAALLAYGESGNTVKYRTWNGSAWSAEASGATGGNAPIWPIGAAPGVASGQVFLAWNMDNAQLRASSWSGTSFSAATAFGPSGSNKEYQTFMAAVTGGGISAFDVSSWMELPRYP